MCLRCLVSCPSPLQSLQRRACARSSLGMHRAALQDLQQALDLKASRDLQLEARKAKEMLRASIRRVPAIGMDLQVVAIVPNMPSADPAKVAVKDDARLEEEGEEAAAAAPPSGKENITRRAEKDAPKTQVCRSNVCPFA